MNGYDQDVLRVCEYIQLHLDDELNVDTLTSVSGFSKYHFHRIFSSYTGFSITKFIHISRLKRASLRLAFKPAIKIIDIGFEAGFDSAEAFSRAFKREFGQSPSQFRKSPEWVDWRSKTRLPHSNIGQNMNTQRDVIIIDFPTTKVAALEHHGAPELHYETTIKFIAWRKESKLSPVNTSKSYGIPYADPQLVKPEDFRFDLCGEVEQAVPENDHGVVNKIIPAGRCAVVRHMGGRDNLRDSVYYLYRDWLPMHQEMCRDFPVFFHYHNFIQDVNEHELITDVYLPIQ
ncbi:AraC family transcriptional regulator [Marinomonas sp.]|nr:AraC family transcriptional regulator [Marinomonas sp.]MDB4836967.1 AraC family transcriptional regulator [Marinomonas sp.]